MFSTDNRDRADEHFMGLKDILIKSSESELPFPTPKIQDVPLKLQGFTCATSLNLTWVITPCGITSRIKEIVHTCVLWRKV